MKLKTPRGTYDILPPASGIWREIEEKAREICSLYNYSELRTPVFEDTSLFVRGIGQGTDIVEKEMYTFDDKKPNPRSFTLRPEGTAPAVRAYIEHNLGLQGGVVKLFYMGPFFRYERMQAGRQRQFHQFGAEALGSDNPALDAEIIMLASDFLRGAGIGKTSLALNNTGCARCRGAYMEKLRGYLEPRAGELCADCGRRTLKNPLRIFDCKNSSCAPLKESAPAVADFACGECAEHFARVKSFLEAAGAEFRTDRFLVRGLDYYTRTTFEFSHPDLGAQDALAGGGRYDSLVEQLGGPPAPAAGFACGMERILLAREAESSVKAARDELGAFAACAGNEYFMKTFRLASRLRAEGLACDMDYQGRSLKSQMKLADRLNSEFVLIVSDELILRDMKTGGQESLPFERIIEILVNRKNPGD